MDKLPAQETLLRKENRKLERIIQEKGISIEYNLLTNLHFIENRRRLEVAKPVSEVEKLIIGRWLHSKTCRVTGLLADVARGPAIEYTSTGRFQTQRQGRAMEGRYKIAEGGKSNLILTFDEPQLPPFHQEMLQRMTPQEIEEMSYDVELWNLFAVGKNQFITHQTHKSDRTWSILPIRRTMI